MLNFKILIIINFIFTALVFSGCEKTLKISNKTGNNYERGLQHTKVGAISYKKQTKAILNVTYLNAFYPNKWDNEFQNFLVGIYISEDNEIESTKFIHNSRYTLTIDNKKYTKYSRVKKDDKLYKNIPLFNPWARYYVISVYKNKSNNLNINYKNPNFGSISISFEKE